MKGPARPPPSPHPPIPARPRPRPLLERPASAPAAPNLKRSGRSSGWRSAEPSAGPRVHRAEDVVLASTCSFRYVGLGPRASGLKPRIWGAP